MPPSSLLASLGYSDLSSSSTPSTLTSRNNIDAKEKERLLRKTRKLSQILGELPHATVAPALPVRNDLTVEVPSTGFSQLHVPSSGHSFTEPSSRSPRYSHIFHTVGASTMPPPIPSVDRDDSNQTGPKRLSTIIPAQLDLTRFGLGRRQYSESTISTHSDENASHVDHRSLVAETETLSDSTNLHSLDHTHVKRPRNKPRWRSVYNPGPMELNARPRNSEDSSMPAYSSKRSVSLWKKRSISNEDHTLADQSQGDITSQMRPPLTESQRITSLRKARKLAQASLAKHATAQSLNVASQVFGTLPPIGLYCSPSRVEDEPSASDTVQRERERAYLALSSGNFCSVNSERSSRRGSHSSLSGASTVSISNNDVEASRESTSDRTTSHIMFDHEDDPDLTAQGSRDRPEESLAFRRRRLRAAKLSRFFGVTYNDLIRQNDRGRANPQYADVDVRIDGPGRFWNGDSNQISEGGMNDVIALLRQMPRA